MSYLMHATSTKAMEKAMSRANYYITFCENVEKNNNESRPKNWT